jgi:hypothetical protein
VPAANPLLYIGLADFAEPTLLILGDSEGFLFLADLISSRWTGSFSSLSSTVRLGNVDVNLSYSTGESGIERCGTRLCWCVPGAAVELFPEQLRALARSEGPHHAYLDTPSKENIQIVASKSEYDPAGVFGTPQLPDGRSPGSG